MQFFRTIYRRNLPHFQQPGTVLFFTYRLAGSLPKHVLLNLKNERNLAERQIARTFVNHEDARSHVRLLRWKIYAKWEHALNQESSGPTWLKIPSVAEIVQEAILKRHPYEYDLVCFCIMPNHVHQVIIHIQEKTPVYRILGNLKSFTGMKANRILKRSGRFWQSESFDHVVRQGKLQKTIRYVLNNPVAANLVANWRDWPYSWVNPRFGGLEVMGDGSVLNSE